MITSKVLAIGLDGVPLGLIEKLTAAGEMPFMAELLKCGTSSCLRSSLPAVSSASWASVMTGCNPGRHGVFGFFSLDRNGQYVFPNYTTLAVPTLWDHLGKQQLRSLVINVPHTYPARPHLGTLISGFVAIDMAKAVCPVELLPRLKELDYRIDIDYQRAREEPERFFRELFYMLDRRAATMMALLENDDWQLALLTFTGTDRLHHFFYRDFVEGGKFQDQFVDFYRRLDSQLRRIVEWYGTQGELMMLADHGFCPLQREIYVNAWLEEQGYLAWQSGVRQNFTALAPSTRAFCLEPGRIYLRRQEYCSNGVVAAADVDVLLPEIAERLQRLQVDGQPVVEKIYFGRDIYHGEQRNGAPDLVVVGHRGYELKGSVNYPALSGDSRFQGMHTPDDALLFIRDAELRSGILTVEDVAPTMLHWLGSTVPEYMDGKSITK